MSGRMNLRKRGSQLNCKELEGTPEKKIKTEQKEQPEETVQTKQPIVAPNGKVFYPCQYCSKIFPHKTTSISHMKKCPNKNQVLSENKAATKIPKSNINNNSVEVLNEPENENVNGNEKCGPRIMISQNITVKQAESDNHLYKQMADPASIYDYDEEDDDKSEEKDSKENDEDASNNRVCKHCETLFENPLDLLRHNRDCHKFPRTILPPNEIEKYFDLPNREFCPICKKPIKTRNFRSVFIKHLLVHTTGLTHECRICKKKFRRQDHMKAHEKRHIVAV